jgi:hypothetical protein
MHGAAGQLYFYLSNCTIVLALRDCLREAKNQSRLVDNLPTPNHVVAVLLELTYGTSIDT